MDPLFFTRFWDRFEVVIYRKLYDQSYLIYIQCTSIKNGEELCHQRDIYEWLMSIHSSRHTN